MMRTILFATRRVTAGDAETAVFIGILLLFALAAAAAVLAEGLKVKIEKAKRGNLGTLNLISVVVWLVESGVKREVHPSSIPLGRQPPPPSTNTHKDEGRNRFKLLLHCIMIVTSVVPPELPMELSLAVTNSLAALTRALVYCTEPFRIPYAGKVGKSEERGNWLECGDVRRVCVWLVGWLD